MAEKPALSSLLTMSAEDEPPFAAGRPLVRAAFAWASGRHVGQSRAVDDAPFILHPAEVASLLSSHGYDDEVIAAALLHDVVENTETGIADVRVRFGARVAGIVAAVTEDETIEDDEERKAALREQVAGAGSDAQAVYAADKLAKTRELRAQAANDDGSADDADLDRRLGHYEQSLKMLQAVTADSPFVPQLAFELWAITRLPPRGHGSWATRTGTPSPAG
jgi:(p)ppGpp synthase/HD superfamily hydrolase